MKNSASPLLLAALAFWPAAVPSFGQTGAASQSQDTAKPAPAKTAPAATEPSMKPQGNADEPENDPALMLTDDQKARIKAIRDDASQQILAAQKDKTLTDDQRERRIKEIRKTTRAQVFAVLTPDQQKTWSWEQREKREAKKSPPKSQ